MDGGAWQAIDPMSMGHRVRHNCATSLSLSDIARHPEIQTCPQLRTSALE